jgi:hypothetical protein
VANAKGRSEKMNVNSLSTIQNAKLSKSFKRIDENMLRSNLRLPKTNNVCLSSDQVSRMKIMFEETQVEEKKVGISTRLIQWTGIFTMFAISTSLFLFLAH